MVEKNKKKIPTIYFLMGLPASGKSTWAKAKVQGDKGQTVRVNKDTLRELMFNSKWSKDRERQVLNTRDFIIKQALSEGKSVVVDDTNFSSKHYEAMMQIASDYEVKMEVVNFDTPLVECIERNRKRENPVPERIIWDMYYKYILPKKVKTNIYHSGAPSALIVDVDGTLAIHEERSPFEYHKCLSDKPNEYLINLIRELSIKHNIIIVTGRENVHYSVGEFYEYPDVLSYTTAWLDKNQVPYDKVYIREEGDHRKDYIVKKDIWEKHIRGNYNIVGVFDDRRQVINMWRELGLFVMDIAGHEF